VLGKKKPITKLKWIDRAYQDYALGKMTLRELSQKYKRSVRSLRSYFDAHVPDIPNVVLDKTQPLSLVMDATFFGRTRGWLIIRSLGVTLHDQPIETEKIEHVEVALRTLEEQGYGFASFTLDGRRGLIHRLQDLYLNVPIEMCQFHQAQIVRRYITTKPKTKCAQQLSELMKTLTTSTAENFAQSLHQLIAEHQTFLNQRNSNKQFKHRRLRSALRSLKTNLPYLFTHKLHPHLNIPNTTNTCDGSFAHWKQKLKIHRGLRPHRQHKMFHFLLHQPTQNLSQ
jgi:hypothetical protein